ncbi:MAG: PEGA domain-containing protein [Pseudomonadales bacterium]|nr:PEGA domain-containing protein [Pseudomonadales bacterium]
MAAPRNNEAADPIREAADVIRPIGYQPPAAESGTGFHLSRWQIGLGVVLLPVLISVWFLFTAQSVRLEFSPPADAVEISGGLSFELGGIHLLREGQYRVRASAAGHEPLDTVVVVDERPNQVHRFAFVRLPGLVTFESTPAEATVLVDGTVVGQTPTSAIEVAAGERIIRFEKSRYQATDLTATVTGMRVPETVSATLRPDWADVTISSQPAGAEILIDDVSTAKTTPATVEVLSGEREIRLKLPGHRGHRQRILVAAEEQVTLPRVTLQQADGLLNIVTQPRGAGVTLNGQFQGETPLEVAVRSGTRYRIQLFKAGYEAAEQSVTVQSGQAADVNVTLQRQMGDIVVTAEPAEAQLYVNGTLAGDANRTLRLPTTAQRLEIRLDGYAGYSTEITPRNGLTQEVRVRLLTLAEARLAALKPRTRTAQNQELVLVKPGPFTMGASRRQPGRRANETLREVQMQRFFYIGTHEVTNGQFRAFATGHDSGEFQGQDLNKDDLPVVNLSWNDAALYCNWLSGQEQLPLFYQTEFGKVTGINAQATGYRLPTEAEWAWSARQEAAEPPLVFAWGGNLPPPDRFGNFADRSAAHLVGRIIFGYNDNHIASAPPGTFTANRLGLYDMAGNVAEWTNDFYEIPGAEATVDPLGPPQGEYRVIRGSSWMHGTITDLRISFRDYGADGRQDLGFRLARFAEPN